MTGVLDLAAANLVNPALLAFGLGMGAGAAKAELEIPDAIAQGLSIYLMLAIGLKGGASIAASPDPWAALPVLGAGVLLSAALPLLAYAVLGLVADLDRLTRAAVAAHYGSISVVTFVTASHALDGMGVPWEGHLVGVAAIMETPAILTGLWLARRGGAREARSSPLRQALLHGSVWLLVGGLVIGLIGGPERLHDVEGFFVAPFAGVLCLFLLDLGLVVTRRANGLRQLGPRLVGFAILQALIGGAVGVATAAALGLSVGGATLLAILGGSASYIAVPAAMRMALPDADPSVYVPLSLGVTFPFNLVVGIPLWHGVASVWLG